MTDSLAQDLLSLGTPCGGHELNAFISSGVEKIYGPGEIRNIVQERVRVEDETEEGIFNGVLSWHANYKFPLHVLCIRFHTHKFLHPKTLPLLSGYFISSPDDLHMFGSQTIPFLT